MIAERYWDLAQVGEGDFSERLLRVAAHVISEYKARHQQRLDQFLDNSELTDLIYKTNIRELRRDITSYLKFMEET